MMTPNRIFIISTLVIVAILALNGCASQPVVDTVIVKTPVAAHPDTPAILKANPITTPLPVAISPTDKRAVIAFDQADSDRLKNMLASLKIRIDEWSATNGQPE